MASFQIQINALSRAILFHLGYIHTQSEDLLIPHSMLLLSAIIGHQYQQPTRLLIEYCMRKLPPDMEPSSTHIEPAD